jgi:hypothetical protein
MHSDEGELRLELARGLECRTALRGLPDDAVALELQQPAGMCSEPG